MTRSNGKAAAVEEQLFDLATVDRLLRTTRAVRRRLDLDRPVPTEVIQDCLELAVQAPTANNREHWRWVVVVDPAKRAAIAEHYRIAWRIHSRALKAASGRGRRGADYERHFRNRASADWLAENLHRVPVHIIACLVGRPPITVRAGDDRIGYLQTAQAALAADSLYYGSIYPAIWSLQLALRSRGLGSAITVAHLPFEREVAKIARIPHVVTQVALLPVAYTRGTSFAPARRTPAREHTYWDTWDARR